MIGITGYGAYVPRLRLERQAIVQANNWFAPGLRGSGRRAMANWDEDSLTMAVEACRDALGAADDRSGVHALLLASTTLPFADRLNVGVVKEALTLDDSIRALDIGGSTRCGLSALVQAASMVSDNDGQVLVATADRRKAAAASAQELDYGDAAAAVVIGKTNVLAELLGSGCVTEDFVDHFRATGADFDYAWEERWVREEGFGKLVPKAIERALTAAGVAADRIDHFILPTTIRGTGVKLASSCGLRAEAVVDTLAAEIGDSGSAHALLMLAAVLERARPGELILVAQFGHGAEACVLRVTDAIAGFRPRTGVRGWLAQGVAESRYTKFLAFNGLLPLERGMRAEQDKKTALTTLHRNRGMLLGLVGGRCRETGAVHFPPSRLSVTPGQHALDTQEPYKLAERHARVRSWSADFLSYCPSPPNHYGYVDFNGGGRCFMEITDVAPGEVENGMRMRMSFRIKDVDERRNFTRYFWKAVPLRDAPAASETAHG
jgi:3-hydroxy-3-methylglutaryl CoA synthase